MNNTKFEKAALIKMLKLLVSCIKSGTIGFSLFFSVLLASKYLSTLIGQTEVFTVEFSDILLSLIGFILTFLIKLLTDISPEESREKSMHHRLKN